tara:strand:+ start:289 stop:585 length:297 start_codon:yes stop_codon:yes gene_type:complete
MMNDKVSKNLHDKATGRGKFHPEYGSYPKPSWKLEAGESDRPWESTYVPTGKSRSFLVAPVVNTGSHEYSQIPSKQNKNIAMLPSETTSLSSNDSARG